MSRARWNGNNLNILTDIFLYDSFFFLKVQQYLDESDIWKSFGSQRHDLFIEDKPLLALQSNQGHSGYLTQVWNKNFQITCILTFFVLGLKLCAWCSAARFVKNFTTSSNRNFSEKNLFSEFLFHSSSAIFHSTVPLWPILY